MTNIQKLYEERLKILQEELNKLLNKDIFYSYGKILKTIRILILLKFQLDWRTLITTILNFIWKMKH